MKVAAIAALALLVASPFAILGLEALGVGPAFEAKPPEWESGYTWTWDVTGRGRVTGEGLGLVRWQSEDLRVDATRNAEVLNTTVTMEDERLSAVLEAFRVDQVRYGSKTVFDGGDHATEMADGFAGEFFCVTPCGTFLTLYTEDANPWMGTEAFDEAGEDHVRLLDFPLTRGKTWPVVAFEEDDVRFELEAKVIDNEYVNIDGFAPFHSVRIEAQVTEATKEAIKQLIKKEAGSEGYVVDLDFDIRFTYWYAPTVQNIIQLDLDGFIAGRATGYGAAGSGRVDFHLDQVLSDYSLDARPARTLDEAMALAEAAWANGGGTSSASPDPWPFQVGASTVSTPAGEDSAVSFGLAPGASADADPGEDAFTDAPAGNKVVWTHRYDTADGPQVERAEGDTATFTMETPGLHVVSAQVLDPTGRVRGADHIAIESYTHETLEADLPVGGLMPDDALAADLYVAPGAREGRITLTADALARGTLTVSSAALHESDEHTVIATEPVEVLFQDLRSGPRAVEWIDDARGGGLTMTIEVRYDREAGKWIPDSPTRASAPSFQGPWAPWLDGLR